MKKSVANKGAMKVRKMIDLNEPIHAILAFASGYGFDYNNVCSNVYFNRETGTLATTVRNKTQYNYYYINP